MELRLLFEVRCECVFTDTCADVSIGMCGYAHGYVWISMCMRAFTSVYMHAGVCSCVYVSVYVWGTHACTHVLMCTHVRTCQFVCN